MKSKDLEKELKEVIETQKKRIEQLSGSDNWQVMSAKTRHEYLLEAFNAVYQKVKGDGVLLSIYKE